MSTPERHAYVPTWDGSRAVEVCGYRGGKNWCFKPADHEVHGGRIEADDICMKPHAGDPDPCDCGYPGAPAEGCVCEDDYTHCPHHPVQPWIPRGSRTADDWERMYLTCEARRRGAERRQVLNVTIERLAPSAGDAATDVDSTAEVCEHAGCSTAWTTEMRENTHGHLHDCCGADDHGCNIPFYEPSAGSSPVTAGVPDTAACGCVEGYEWRARQDAVCGNCPRRGETSAGVPDTAAIQARHDADIELCCDCVPGEQDCDESTLLKLVDSMRAALDAARGELVTARGERDAWETTAVENEAGYKESLRAWRADMDTLADERDELRAERDGLKCLLDSSILKGQGYCGARHWNGGTCFHPAGHPVGHPEHYGDADTLRAELAAANARIAAAEALCAAVIESDDEQHAAQFGCDTAGESDVLVDYAQDVRAALAGVPAAGDD